MTKLQEVLKEVADAFTTDKRSDDTEFWILREGCAPWMRSERDGNGNFMLRVHEAVDGRGPDDWIYEHTYRMASELAESNAGDEFEWDAEEAILTSADSLVDIYTADRLRWLAMNLHNYAIVDETVEEQGGATVGILDCIAVGQCEVLRRIGQAVVDLAREELDRREGCQS